MTEIPDGGKLHADHWSTEQQAALLQTSERKRATYEQILRLLGQSDPVAPGMTDDELRRALHNETGAQQSKSGPATRRGELVDMGLVRPQRRRVLGTEFTAEVAKRPSDLGVPMIVWELVPADEYVKPEPKPTERQADARGLAVAERYAEWELGDAGVVGAIIRAYLNPKVVTAELDKITGSAF